MGQEIWKQVSPALVNVAVALILAILAVVGARCQVWAAEQAKLVKAKTTKEQREIILSIVDGVVQAVEQLYKKGVIKKPAKFDEAFSRARKNLTAAGLNPSDEQVADMIEAAVKAMGDFGGELKTALEEASPGEDVTGPPSNPTT